MIMRNIFRSLLTLGGSKDIESAAKHLRREIIRKELGERAKQTQTPTANLISCRL